LTVAVAAGCGGGGGSSKNKAYSSSPAKYAAALNSICAPAEAKVKALHASSLQDVANLGPKIKGLIQDAVNKMDKLEPPSQVKGTADDFIAKEKASLSKFDDLISAAKSGDAAKTQQVAQGIAALDQAANQDASKLGAAKCAQTG
jgi:hypothetical protein